MFKFIVYLTLVLFFSSCTFSRYQFLEKSDNSYWLLDTSNGDIIRKSRANEVLEVKEEGAVKVPIFEGDTLESLSRGFRKQSSIDYRCKP